MVTWIFDPGLNAKLIDHKDTDIFSELTGVSSLKTEEIPELLRPAPIKVLEGNPFTAGIQPKITEPISLGDSKTGLMKKENLVPAVTGALDEDVAVAASVLNDKSSETPNHDLLIAPISTDLSPVPQLSSLSSTHPNQQSGSQEWLKDINPEHEILFKPKPLEEKQDDVFASSWNLA